ncbi:Smad/fha domain, partial [Globisporangium splendens]
MRNFTRLAEAQAGDSDGHTVAAVLKGYVDCFLSQTDAIPLTPRPGGTGSIIVRVHEDSHTASLIWAASMAYSRKDTTNNFAEYWGLIHGLREAQRSHFEPLMHRSPRQHRLTRLYQTSRRLADCIDIRGWYHHYRAFNKMADSAANLTMDTRTSTQVHFPTHRAAFNNLAQDLDNDVMHWLVRSPEDPSPFLPRNTDRRTTDEKVRAVQADAARGPHDRTRNAMQHESASSDATTTVRGVPACCFRWEIMRGPHEDMLLTHCVHEDATATLPHALKVGRHKQCWMRLRKDLEVSSVHAEFRVQVDGTTADADAATAENASGVSAGNEAIQRVVLCDLNSTNGTKLNGEPLVPYREYPLADQDLIHFGKTAVRFRNSNNRNVEEPKQDESSSCAVVIVEEPDEQQVRDTGLVEQTVAAVVFAQSNTVDGHTAAPQATQMNEEEQSVNTSEPMQKSFHDAGGGFATEEGDAFEIPSTTHQAMQHLPASSSTASGASTMACMICTQWLGHLDVLEQQLHINACLDGRQRPSRPVDAWPLLLQPAAVGAARNKRAVPKTQGTKRKRARDQSSSIEDEEIAMAVAMSKSITNKEQEVDMDIALFSGELAQIDAQMAKLAKKRDVLLKKIAKLEKTKAKVKKSTVLLPSETRILLDLAKVLQVLFPQERIVLALHEDDAWRRILLLQKKKTRAVASQYAPGIKRCLFSDNSEPLPPMWVRASQQLFGHMERDLYQNSILLPFVGRENQERDVEMEEVESAAAGSNPLEKAQTAIEQQHESAVPDVVKRVFPDWAENLAFLRQQRLEDLEEALHEMSRQRQDRLNEEPESEDEVPMLGSGSSSKAEEDQACAYFESVIRELIQTKLSAGGAREVIDVEDSDDMDDDQGSNGAKSSIISIDDTSEREMEGATESAMLSEQQADMCFSPSHEVPTEEEFPADSELIGADGCLSDVVASEALTVCSALEERIENALQEDIPSDSAAAESQAASLTAFTQPTAGESTLLENSALDASKHHSTVLPHTEPLTEQLDSTPEHEHHEQQQSIVQCGSDESMETQLLRVLKAHPMFYEMVLLHRPLDVTAFFQHIIGHKFSNEHLQDHLYPVAHMLWRYMSASLIHAIWCAHLRRMDSDPIKSTAEMAIMMTRLEAGMRNLTRLAEAQAGDSDGHTVAAVLKAYVDCFLSQTDAIPLTPSDTRGVYLLFFDGGSRGNPGPGGTGSIIVRVHKDSHTASLIWAASMANSRKDTTNNFAEYWGLIHGLREAQRSHFEPLMHRSPRQHRLTRLYQTSRRLADCINIRGWYHHYRAFNKMADSAANLAMDTRTSTQVHFPTHRAAFNNLAQDLDNDVMHWLMRSSEDPRSLDNTRQPHIGPREHAILTHLHSSMKFAMKISPFLPRNTDRRTTDEKVRAVQADAARGPHDRTRNAMQHESASSDATTTVRGVPACCFRWEIMRGPHEDMLLTHCVHEDATATLPHALKVGRHKQCWMRLRKDLEVSSVHAEFRVQVDGTTADADAATAENASGVSAGNEAIQRVVLCDLNSTNGTKLNGEPLVPYREYPLADQDLIHFGKTAVRFRNSNNRNVEEPKQDESSSCAVVIVEEPDEQQVRDTGLVEQTVAAVVFAQSNTVDGHTAAPQATQMNEEEQSVNTSEPMQKSFHDAGGGFATEEGDAFEIPSTTHQAMQHLPASSSTASGASTMACMICTQWLGHLDVLEQQLHINACLDGRQRPSRPVDAWPLLLQPAAVGAARNKRAVPKTQGTKRKRARDQSSSIEDEEIAMAVAMSKSITNKEQEVDMDIALFSGELAQIDAQMAKLAKKRDVLLKKIAKLEKTKAKVKKSTVLLPSETRILLDLAKVLQVLFPQERIVLALHEDDAWRRILLLQKKKTRAVASQYAPGIKRCLFSDNSEPLPPMWVRASQQLFGHMERDLYQNSILLPFVGRENQERDVEMEEVESAAAGSNPLEKAQTAIEQQHESAVPDVVKRVFPDWAENLAFLRQQRLEDLEEALHEMSRQRQDRLNEEPESEDEVPMLGSGSSSKAEEDQACAYFESVIRELIQTKLSAGGAREVIDVEDSDDMDDDQGSNGAKSSIISIDDTSEREMEGATESAMLSEQQADMCFSPSHEVPTEEEFPADSELIGADGCLSDVVASEALTVCSALEERIENALQEDIPSDSAAAESQAASLTAFTQPTAGESTLLENSALDASKHHSTVLPHTEPLTEQLDSTPEHEHHEQQQSIVQCGSDESMETQLLRVLKAHPMFYEMVLLHRPLDVTAFFQHIIGHKFSNEHLQDHLYPVAHMLWRYMSASLIHAIWCAHLRRMDSDPIESTAEMAIMMTRLEAGMRNLTRLAEAQAGDSDGHTVAAVLKAYVDCFLSQTDAIPLTPSDTRGVYLLFFDGGSRGNPGPGGTGSIIVRVHKDSHTASLIWAASMANNRKDTTNNFAEYWGLIHGLREAQRSHFEPFECIGLLDSTDWHVYTRQVDDSRIASTSEDGTITTVPSTRWRNQPPT